MFLFLILLLFNKYISLSSFFLSGLCYNTIRILILYIGKLLKMNSINKKVIEHLFHFNDVNYNEMFLNSTSVKLLENICSKVNINDFSLTKKYFTINLLNEEICDFFFANYPSVLKKDDIFILLFNHPELSNEYLKKIASLDIISDIYEQGLLNYYYKSTKLSSEGLFRVLDIYSEYFFEKNCGAYTRIPEINFYPESSEVYKKYEHVVKHFCNQYKIDENTGFEKYGEAGLATFYNLGFIDISEISTAISKQLKDHKFFELQKIIDNNQLNKEIINKLFHFEKPFQKKDISFNYRSFIHKIPASLINEKDKAGNSILDLLKEISPDSDVTELLSVILNKGYDITTIDNNNEIIFLKDLLGVCDYYHNNIGVALMNTTLNFIFDNLDKYIDNKEVICKIGNDLLTYNQLITERNVPFMESIFAMKEKEKLNNLLSEDKNINNVNKKRL